MDVKTVLNLEADSGDLCEDTITHAQLFSSRRRHTRYEFVTG
eukprot:COSAG03_NODE_19794_length_330_cov_0.173160_1_plen_41_part_10